MSAKSLFSLDGKVALVTGASSGIGLAIATGLAGAGARVVLLARRQAELEAAAGTLNDRRPGSAAALPCNLSDRKELIAAAARSATFFGAPDILVNCAGINLRKPAMELTPEDWDAHLRLNLDAPHFLTRELVPAMIERRWGRIINIASLQSVRAFADSIPYGTTKGGLMQLTRAQAQAWSRHGINANAIAPGFFPTDLTAPVTRDPARWQAMADKTFIGRNGELDELHGVAIFLASDASSFITGQTIFVDGGFSAG